MRLQGFDYTQPACYFITICAQDFKHHWGIVEDEYMINNTFGRIVENEWYKTAVLRDNLTLDAFTMMPNHIHGIITLHPKEGERSDFYMPNFLEEVPIEKIQRFAYKVPDSIPLIVGQFKSSATREVRKAGFPLDVQHWQKGYYERVIRSRKELENVRRYIENNPVKWDIKYNAVSRIIKRMTLVL